MDLMISVKYIYEKYKKDVYIYLVGLTHNPNLSEDLLSETFLAVIKSLPNFKNQSDIKTWLFSVARHKWYEYLRKTKQATSFDDFAQFYIFEEDLLDKTYQKQVVSKVMELLEAEPPMTKEIVLMRIYGYSFHEIANKHQISESSSRVINFRIKKKIKEKLLKEGFDFE